MKICLSALISLSLVFLSSITYACECPDGPQDQLWEQADIVFYGQVEEILEANEREYDVKFELRKPIKMGEKGPLKNFYTIRTLKDTGFAVSLSRKAKVIECMLREARKGGIRQVCAAGPS